MKKSLNQKQLIRLLVVIGLVFLLPLVIFVALQRQDIRNRAAGSNEVGLRLVPTSGTFSPGQSVSLDVAMYKIASRAINVSGAQSTLSVSTKFTINSAVCLTPFNALPFVNINGSTVTVMCAIAATANPVALTTSNKIFARLNLTVKGTATTGSAPVSFTSTRVTEAGIKGQAPDVSTAGTSSTYTISTGGGNTPTPTGGGSRTTPTPTPTPRVGNPTNPPTIRPTSPPPTKTPTKAPTKAPTKTPNPTSPVNPTLTPQGNEMSISFNPSSATLPPNTAFNIVIDAQARNIAFGRVVFTFDPSKVNLAGEISTNSNLSTVVEKSTMSAANSAGKAIIVIAASPTDSQPTGIFEFASFTLKSVSGINGDSTTVTYDTADMQIVDGTGAAIALAPSSLTLTLNTDNISGLPTEAPGVGDFEVPIGSKDTLTITISGGGLTPTVTPGGPTPTAGPSPTPPPAGTAQITFTAKLNHTVNNPDMYMRLRVKDDLFFLNNPGSTAGTCTQAGAGEKDFYVPMRHDGSVFRPVSSINAPAPSGTIADVTPNGWVVLNGINAENYYTFILKAPKFRGTKTSEHNFLSGGQNSGQNFAWDASPLEPGDLLNPNQGSVQDCTVNSVDISLMVARLGTTDQANLDVADVNFDSIVNGNDISKVVNTLSSKPDDDL